MEGISVKQQMTVRVYTSTEQTAMKESEKDRLASEVAELRTTFNIALSDKRKYPVQEFRAVHEECAPLYSDD